MKKQNDKHVAKMQFCDAFLGLGVQVQGLYFNTIPSSAASLVGQRKQLSAGDIKQALDAYRCRSGNKHNGR